MFNSKLKTVKQSEDSEEEGASKKRKSGKLWIIFDIIILIVEILFLIESFAAESWTTVTSAGTGPYRTDTIVSRGSSPTL